MDNNHEYEQYMQELKKAFGDKTPPKQLNVQLWNTVTVIGWWTSVAGIIILISYLIVNR